MVFIHRRSGELAHVEAFLHSLNSLQETTNMLQTQLQGAQQELKEAAQQHREECAAFQKDRVDLQKQVRPFYLPHSPSHPSQPLEDKDRLQK